MNSNRLRKSRIKGLLRDLKATLEGSGPVVSKGWMDIGERLGVNFREIPPADWLTGCEHELEHAETVGGNREIIARIAWDHLREDARYYRKLARVESA